MPYNFSKHGTYFLKSNNFKAEQFQIKKKSFQLLEFLSVEKLLSFKNSKKMKNVLFLNMNYCNFSKKLEYFK